MSEDVMELLDDYVVRFRRGERPDLREYLERAGPAADELGDLVERFLQAVPAPPADEASVARWRAVVEEPPLLELRKRQGLHRAEVVDGLMRLLALDPAKRDKVKRCYHELETGQIEPDRVDARVWQALAETLKQQVETLRAWAGPPISFRASQPVFARVVHADASRLELAKPDPEEPDEIDRLFGRTDR